MMWDLWDVPEASLSGSHGEGQLAAKWDILNSDRSRHSHVNPWIIQQTSIHIIGSLDTCLEWWPVNANLNHKNHSSSSFPSENEASKASRSTNCILCITGLKFDSSAMTNSCVILTRKYLRIFCSYFSCRVFYKRKNKNLYRNVCIYTVTRALSRKKDVTLIWD